jgi:outer membrane beta-barrel protein
MKRRFVTGLFVTLPLLAGVGVLGTASRAQADEITLTGPLKGAPAVRRLRLYRQGRFELTPTVSFSLLDEYRRTILPGLRLTYNITDWLGVTLWGAFGAISSTTSLTDQIDQVAPRDDRTAANVAHNGPNVKGGKGPTFADQTAKLSYISALQATFTPFRGKLALFQKIFVDTDFYASGGLAAVGIQERAACGAGGGQKACTDPQSFALDSSTKLTYTLGLGLTFYPGDWFSFGVDYRVVPFAWNRAGFDTQGAGNNNKFPDGKVDSQDDTYRFNQFVTIFFGFSFPTAPRISD